MTEPPPGWRGLSCYMFTTAAVLAPSAAAAKRYAVEHGLTGPAARADLGELERDAWLQRALALAPPPSKAQLEQIYAILGDGPPPMPGGST
jgi:hypothetical protein